MPKRNLTQKERKQLRDNSKRIDEIRARFQEMGDLLATEKRALSADEKEEKTALEAELSVLQTRNSGIEAGTWDPEKDDTSKDEAFDVIIRSMVNKKGIPDEYQYLRSNGDGGLLIPANERSVQDMSTVDPLVPVTVKDIILPLEKGLILGKVGCKMQYGITGTWIFPVVAAIEATIEDENAQISDSTIDIGKISPSPKRCALKIPVSNRAIAQSSGLIRDIVNVQVAAGLQRLLNKWMFSPIKISTKASNGCFVKDAPSLVVGSSFTWANVVALEATVLASGVQFDGTAAYVCSAATLGELKSTPKATGSGLMICENGMINGYPVFITEYIGDGKLGFGIFSYEMVGQFGQMSLIVDPYTMADSNITRFILNADFDMMSLRTEAFGIAQKSTTPAIGVNKTSVAMSAAPNGTVTAEVSVSGVNLTADIAAAMDGTNKDLFTVAPASIAKGSDGTAFQKLTITYSPSAAGTHSATLKLTSTGATEVDITIAGTCA